MKILEGIQAIPYQTMNTSLDNGNSIELTLIFRPSVKMWFATIGYNGYEINNIRVCNFPNLLQQYNKILPFGLNVNVLDGGEPFLIDDFYTGRVVLSVLTLDEVEQINESYKEAK